jgi:three-Cys-motif partner protein
MSKPNRSFFRGKRAWSAIKDKVLRTYMPPYLSKVKTLGYPVILVDCFAGRGKFDDGTPGSPLIMCQLTKKYAPTQGKGVFVNSVQSDHAALKTNLATFIREEIAYLVYGNSHSLLLEVQKAKANFTLFMYLDPFGLKGCDFGTIKTLLDRGKQSTELLINLSMPALHRLAACNAVISGRGNSPEIREFHKILDDVFGGDYWKHYMFNANLSRDEKEQSVVREYMARLKQTLPYVGSCPVREKEGAVVKYFITFASRHPDALLLMNDTMCAAYNEYIHEVTAKDLPLLKPAISDWKASRSVEKRRLKALVRAAIQIQPGLTRQDIWKLIVEANFMGFIKPEYLSVIQDPLDAGEIHSPTARPTKRLNDSCVLKIGPGERLAG